MDDDKTGNDEAQEVGTTPPREQGPLTSLESLTGRMHAGAVEKFSAYYRDQTPRLVTFLLMQGAPEALAAELAQEVMTDLWRHWDAVLTPKAWTKTAATRAWIRYRTRVPELPMDIPADSPLLHPSSDTGEGAEQVHIQHELLALLAMLPARQRHVMALTYDDWSPAEIAAELGISEATIRATIRDARKKLRRHQGLDSR
jgi:RNA polymerase sigma factor (sigma-70 family)